MIRDGIDNTLQWLKWPVACAALFVLPGTLIASVALVGTIYDAVAERSAPFWFFLIGFVGYTLLWLRVLRRSRNSYLATLEHELTHALFAWATLHPVTSIRATARKGGSMSYRGKGNWLITISPYFFPTASLVLAVVFLFLPDTARTWFHPLLGIAMAYHLWSTLRETHSGQTDIQRVGFPFAVIFLPTANLLTHGIVLLAAFAGAEAVQTFLTDAWLKSLRLYGL